MTIMSSTIIAPALGPISAELPMSNVEEKMALSAYVLALAFGPLVIAPQSEVWGRLPVIHGWNAWFLVWTLVCGFANNAGLLIAARFLAGLGGSLDYAVRNIEYERHEHEANVVKVDQHQHSGGPIPTRGAGAFTRPLQLHPTSGYSSRPHRRRLSDAGSLLALAFLGNGHCTSRCNALLHSRLP